MVEQPFAPDGCQVITLWRNVSGNNFRPQYVIVGYTVVDDADFQWLNQDCWSMWEDPRTGSCYACRIEHNNGKTINIYMAREILGLSRNPGYGGDKADHVDHNTLNNRRGNLRKVTHSQSMANRRGWSSIQMPKGVRKIGGKFKAIIGFDGLEVCFFTVRVKVEAALMYNYAAYLVHGDCAELNVIPEDEIPTVERQWELYGMVIEKIREYRVLA